MSSYLLGGPAVANAKPTELFSFGDFDTCNALAASPGKIWVADIMGVNAFDSTGGLLHDVKIVDLCTRMAAHKHGELFITCRNDNCVYVFSLNDGSFLREFGKLGDGNGEFSDPRGITVDSMGRLWVADSLNARIQILDRNGAFLGSRGGPSDAEGRAQTIDAVLCNQDTNEVFVSDVSSHRIHVSALVVLGCLTLASACRYSLAPMVRF